MTSYALADDSERFLRREDEVKKQEQQISNLEGDANCSQMKQESQREAIESPPNNYYNQTTPNKDVYD